MPEHHVELTISHWLPIMTFCPVNNLPDFVYIYVTFDSFEELYNIRKLIRKKVSFRKMFMEDIATKLINEIEGAVKVQVRLLTSRHVVTVTKGDL